MKCFYHPESDAVGVCHCCQRGLCPQCAQEVVKAIACKGRCEQDVLALNDLTSRIERRKRLRRERLIITKAYILIGVLMLEWCGMAMLILHNYQDSSLYLFLAAMCLYFGSVFYFTQRKIAGQQAADRWRR